MQPIRPEKLPKRDLWFPCGRYFLRTVKREDASERWAEWLSDPWTVHVLNTAPRQSSRADMIQYIRSFDQRSRLLLGIFEMGTRIQVGFIRVDIEPGRAEALVNAVIGEKDHRDRGATTVTFIPLLRFLFGAAGIQKVRASVLERNDHTLAYLLKLGWQLDPEAEQPVKSLTDGSMLGRRGIHWTRDGFQAWLDSPVGKRVLKRMPQQPG
jgi:RimJ/RimL family protein N-acetyltransferase